jgi:hypothetical protein
MEYTITLANNVFELETIVRMNIKEGWIPQGGVFVAESSQSNAFGQAMIKTDKWDE